MVELREPPRPASEEGSRPLWWAPPFWTGVQLALLAAILLLLAVRSGTDGEREAAAGLRDVASQLRAAGALDEAARTLEGYVASLEGGAERARAAFQLGETYLELGAAGKALRWFYEAEREDDGELREELARKIVHSLERLGRFQAAQSALEERVRLDRDSAATADDPVVARIEEREILLSELERSIDDLPPALQAGLRGRDARREYLKKYVADALLWNKARKLEIDRDAELRRRFEQNLQQMVIARYLEQEVLADLEVDETDLRNFFEANRARYEAGDGPQASLDELRSQVQRDYLQVKAQSAYQDAIDSELAAADVELFPDRLEGSVR